MNKPHGLDSYFDWAHKRADIVRNRIRYALHLAALLVLITTPVMFSGCATQPPATRMHVVMTGNPPQYFSGIVTYRNNHVQRLMVGSDRFLSCQLALADTGPALAKAIETDGWAAKGICIPVPTLDVSDLIPRELF